MSPEASMEPGQQRTGGGFAGPKIQTLYKGTNVTLKETIAANKMAMQELIRFKRQAPK